MGGPETSGWEVDRERQAREERRAGLRDRFREAQRYGDPYRLPPCESPIEDELAR